MAGGLPEDLCKALPDGATARIAGLLARPQVARVLALLNAEGQSARLVGGAVRNILLGREVADIDIATTWLPENVMARAKAAGIRAIPTGIAHGTVTLILGGQPVEITTLREDIATDGRRARVKFGTDYDADARRRDFTINAMSLAISLSPDGVVHDPVGGLDDLVGTDARSGPHIRFIGDPDARIAEDYLRILRYFRFHAHFAHHAPHGPDLEACIAGRAGLATLSRERVRIEVLKLLAATQPVEAAQALSQSGLWTLVTGTILVPGRLALAVPHTSDPAERLAIAAVLKREDALVLGETLRLSGAEQDTLMQHALALEFLAGASSLNDQRLKEAIFAYGVRATTTALIALGLIAGDDVSGDLTQRFAAISSAPPVDPFTGAAVLAQGVPAGKQVGAVLSAARARWIEGGFSPDPVIHKALLAAAIRNLAH